MDSSSEEESPKIALPPFVCANIREKIAPEQIPANEIKSIIKHSKEKFKDNILQPEVPIQAPIPLYPLTISWCPEKLLFEIKEEAIVQRLWVWNSCTRSIYIHCCEIWNETAYLGARWQCYPQTRFHLAPGLMAEMFVRASPKEISPVPCASARLQLAATHKRDHVTGYFAVPVDVTFLNHIPSSGEAG